MEELVKPFVTVRDLGDGICDGHGRCLVYPGEACIVCLGLGERSATTGHSLAALKIGPMWAYENVLDQ